MADEPSVDSNPNRQKRVPMSTNFRHHFFFDRSCHSTHNDRKTHRQLGRPQVRNTNPHPSHSTLYSFGPLSPKLPVNHPELPIEFKNLPFLSLPKGYCYSVVSYAGDIMCDGNRVPTNHGSMAAFRGSQGTTVVLRNHNLRNEDTKVQVKTGSYYDAKRSGGTSTLVFNHRGRLCLHHGSLAGTDSNQTGCSTPWNTWLTCEGNFSEGEERHGYVFEIPSDGFAETQPIREMGRFAHGGAAIDSRSGMIYMTENRSDGLFYRFRPHQSGELDEGGTLEALRIVSPVPQGNSTVTYFNRFAALSRVGWVSIDDPDPDTEFGNYSTRAQGQQKEASTFNRSIGPWYYQGLIYFASRKEETNSRRIVWAFDPECETIMENPTTPFRELVDHIAHEPQMGRFPPCHEFAIDPVGRLCCTYSASERSSIIVADSAGKTFKIVGNRYNNSNFSGLCFSPSNRLMFANISDPGITFVIHGPWKRGLNVAVESIANPRTSFIEHLSTAR